MARFPRRPPGGFASSLRPLRDDGLTILKPGEVSILTAPVGPAGANRPAGRGRPSGPGFPA